MFYQERKKFRKIIFIGVAFSVFIFLSACAANKASKIDTAEGISPVLETEKKLITDIIIEDGKDPVTVSIKGNQLLTYTAVKQPLPLGLVLYFPETSLGIAKREYQAEGDIVASIKAVELIENGPSKVTISLKADSEPIINRSGDGLIISFSLNEQEQTQGMEPAESAESAESPESPDSHDQQQSIQADEFVEEKAVASETGDTSVNIEESIAADVPAVSAEAATVPVDAPEAALLQSSTDTELSARNDGINNFREISAVNADDGISVLIRSDQMINDYKAFSLTDPARIVLDLHNVKSDFKKQQTVPVDSKWLKNIRHFAYPERLRVVLDTEKAYLSSYSVEPSENGLIVMIADSIESEKRLPVMETAGSELEKTPIEPIIVKEEQAAVESTTFESAETESAETFIPAEPPAVAPVIESESIIPVEEPSVQPESVFVKNALVNRIDFLSGDEGRSSIIIGTTRPVTYNLNKIDNIKLSLDLFDTKILSYRQRPLITTRFESAVNRIIPIQTPGMKNNSKIVIELRESVPFTIEKKENEIEIQFEASTIPPKSLEDAGLPPWEKVMKEAALEAEAVLAKAVPTAGDESGTMPAGIETPAGGEDVALKDDQTAGAEPAPDTDQQVEMPVIAEAEPMPAVVEIASEDMPVAAMATDEGLKVDAQILPELAEDAEPAKEKSKKIAHRRYTGEKIALDFYQTDIKNVLRILRDVSGKNFAIDKDVTGSVTLTLVKPIPWDQVLDLILKMNQLGQISEGDIVRIVTISTLRKEEKIRSDELKAAQAIQEQQKALEPLVTEYIPINYADANADIKPRLEQIKTAKRGQVGVDARNNQIIMTDTVEKIAQAKEIIRSIDKVTPQVVIEARIVEVSENFSRDIGTQWGITSGPNINGNDSQTYTMAMNHPPSANSGSIGYQFSRLAGTNFSLNAELQAVEASGEGKIISTPKIVTLDNKEAAISQGIEYPYLERDSSGLSTTKFKKIDLELKVKPHVTPDNRINLNINITKNDIDSITGGVPSLSTNEAKTELLVNDGDTIVIGGILKTNIAQGESRFPMLADIPVLGWLFKSRNNSTQKNELLIFITPKIVHLESKI